jgi:hypothetical protein
MDHPGAPSTYCQLHEASRTKKRWKQNSLSPLKNLNRRKKFVSEDLSEIFSRRFAPIPFVIQ